MTEVEPKRIVESHYHQCNATQMALHGRAVIPCQALPLTWLHCAGNDNSPVFFLLGPLGGHAHHRNFKVVHKGDDFHRKCDKGPPPTSTALTIYRCFDSPMMLFPGCIRDQMFDVRPSGLAQDEQLYVRWRESEVVPGLKVKLDKRPSRTKTWHEILEVRRGP
jgi:hypothetical protein